MKIYHCVPSIEQLKLLKKIEPSLKINILNTIKNEDSSNRGIFYRYNKQNNQILNMIFDSGKIKDYKYGMNQESRYYELIGCYHKRYDFIVSFIDDYESSFDTIESTLSIFRENNISLDKLLCGIKIKEKDVFSIVEFVKDSGCNYIAIATDGCINKEKLAKILAIKNQFPSIKIHLLGISNYFDLKTIKPFSSDSSTATKYASIKRTIKMWDDKNKRMIDYKVFGEERENEESRGLFDSQIQKLEIDDYTSPDYCSVLSMYNFHLMEESLNMEENK